MTEASSTSLIQGATQNSYSTDAVPEQEQQAFTPTEKPDFSSMPPAFKQETSPVTNLQKIEQNKKPEPSTWDNLKAKADSTQGYIEGLVFPLTEMRNQAASTLGIKNHLIESPHYREAYQSGKNDLNEGITYASGFGDGINPMTPIGDAIAETFDFKRQHAGSESTYWKGRIDGSTVGLMVDSALMVKGGAMMGGSAACEVSTLGACTIVAGPGLAAGATLAGAGALSMTGHLTTYSDAQKQYLQSRVKEESAGSRKVKKKSDSTKIGELNIPKKIRDQMIKRGWTNELIEKTKKQPFTKREALNKANNNKATAYFNKDGSHIVVDDITKSIIQVSDRTRSWAPDRTIVNPYISK